MSSDLILFANDAFYAAFAAGSVDQMDGIWATASPVACLHPGHPPLFERAEIIESWRQILSDPGVGSMKMHSAKVVTNDTLGLVVCYEAFGDTTLVATNGFVEENGVWRMTFHQAGLCNDKIPMPEDNGDAAPIH